MSIVISFIISFLCGSIPTGYLVIKKFYGTDIRTMGSGNIGSTNVKRVAGSKVSLIVQAIDILKGVLPVLLGIYVYKIVAIPVSLEAYQSILAVAVILGHDYTPFLSFNGGKGANTTLGAFILIAPVPALVGAMIHSILAYVTKVVSIRSILFGLTIPLGCVLLNATTGVTVAATISAAVMIIRHKDNLRRLVKGEEK